MSTAAKLTPYGERTVTITRVYDAPRTQYTQTFR